MKSFGLIGAAGYIAPRHLRAISDTGNDLLWAVDPSDSVGILDQFFPNAEYYSDIRACGHGVYPAKAGGIRKNQSLITHHSSLDYVSVCSPNYLHEEHIRWALEQGADVICEKPLVTDLHHLEEIERLEKASGRKVNTIMQLRLHPVVEEIRRMKEEGEGRKVVKLEYITARGKWYHNSWKGIEEKSGGITMNIGIHLFDLMIHQFGLMKSCRVILYQPDKAKGELELEHADVEWFLSIDDKDLPGSIREKGHRAFRNITLNGQSVEFTDGFTELHTESYREILAGRGFGINDVRESLRVVETIRRK
ncbi:MAG: Gfo/Idh/MocA family oxidoreductase [Bacteroidota bacterium]